MILVTFRERSNPFGTEGNLTEGSALEPAVQRRKDGAGSRRFTLTELVVFMAGEVPFTGM